MKNRRSLRNVFVRPREQLRMVFGLFGAVLIAQSIMIWFIGPAIGNFMREVVLVYGITHPEVDALRQSIENTVILVSLSCVGLSLFAMLYGVRLSHRIYGPMVPFLAHMKNLSVGNYKSRVRLRDGDEFKDLMNEMNRLAEALEKRGSL